MGNMHLVTGCAGKEHITAADQGAFNAALIGTGQFVLGKGNVLAAQVISNNKIRILDGELMMQGRFIRLDPGTYIDLTIDSGTQGMMRNDLIVARYTKDAVTGVEGCSLIVIKGTAVTESPSDPEYTEGDITNGQDVLNDFPLWRIPISGINVGTPESMFGEPFCESLLTLPEIRQSMNQTFDEVSETLEKFTAERAMTDAQIKEYANNASDKIELVWENASIDSGFGEQTISLDLSDADVVIIVFHSHHRTVFFPKSMFGTASDIQQWRGNDYGWRLVTVKTDGVYFENGKESQYNSNQAGIVKPWYIYKVIKGVRT